MNTLFFFFVLATAAIAAEAEKPLSDLIIERRQVYEEIEQLKKENDKNMAELNKIPAVKEHNVKQKLLSDKFQKAQAKISELNGKIADQVSKEKK